MPRHAAMRSAALRLAAALLASSAPLGGAVGVTTYVALEHSAGRVARSSPSDDAECRDALALSQAKVHGNFAVLEASYSIAAANCSDVFRRQVRALYDCHWLGRPDGDDLAITVASDGEATMSSLASLAQRYRILVVKVDPWPGNLAKLPGYGGLLRALVDVSQEMASPPPRPTRVLLTDCCDVLFRKDAACFGGGSGVEAGSVFDRFTSKFADHGKKVVFSAERGTSMLMSQDDYLLRYHKAKNMGASAEPPVGWLVPINRPLHDNNSKAVQRKRHFSHRPAELPPSPLLLRNGTPDVCTEVDGLCLHPKSFNTGLIMGELEPLAEVYEETIRECGQHCSFDRRDQKSFKQSSDQNPMGHYLIASKFCSGKCSLDYNFTLFHTMQGRPGVYKLSEAHEQESASGNASGNGTHGQQLFIRIPVLKPNAREATAEDVITTKEWIALSPEVFGEDWFSVPACALHAAGLPEPHQAANLALLREGLGVPGPAAAVSWAVSTAKAKTVQQVAVGADGKAEPAPEGQAQMEQHADATADSQAEPAPEGDAQQDQQQVAVSADGQTAPVGQSELQKSRVASLMRHG